jgi:hypothetical protein
MSVKVLEKYYLSNRCVCTDDLQLKLVKTSKMGISLHFGVQANACVVCTIIHETTVDLFCVLFQYDVTHEDGRPKF